MTMIGVLFVCLGNICRSPMAEAVFRHVVKEKQTSALWKIDSCGTSAFHIGEKPDSRSAEECRKHGVPINHSARQVKIADFDNFDYILCMDESNYSDLVDLKPKNSKAQIKLLGSYDPKGKLIVEDPYYGGKKGFEINFQQCLRACTAFHDAALSEHGN
eukprot:GCRY01001325.1.p1 GENE.GCRY01001325.1~~GCRY01001325.1.p1  ORF type:complete len:159 (-),score=28.40 GCRY01001325.1:59-535(-)